MQGMCTPTSAATGCWTSSWTPAAPTTSPSAMRATSRACEPPCPLHSCAVRSTSGLHHRALYKHAVLHAICTAPCAASAALLVPHKQPQSSCCDQQADSAAGCQ